ncbi:MAG TPA: hypothetical protein VKJ00_13600, partial [Thermoanaerobaculia bacterium]|nr:hypothetical protein [Thermoanaerobaculia bacterium]
TIEVRRSDGTAFLPAEVWTPGPSGFNPGTQAFFADVDKDGRADAISITAGFINTPPTIEVRKALWKGCLTIYAGSGENAIRRDTYYGAGLLVGSVDRRNPSNTIWVQRTGAPAFDFRRGSINDVVLDPTTSGAQKRLFITVSSGVTASASEATVTAPQPPGGYGIYQSDDRGNTWSKLSVPGAQGARPTDLERDPGNPAVLYAGFLGRGIFKTTTGGASWCPLNVGVPLPAGCPAVVGLPDVASNFDFVQIAIALSNPLVLYANFGMCPDRLLQSCRPSLFRSTDGGSSWTPSPAALATDPRPGAGSSIFAGIYSRYTHALAVDPRDENTMFFTGLDIWRSTDGGQTVLQSDGTVPQHLLTILHLDGHELVFHPSVPGAAYTTNDGGFAVSNDGGLTWTPRNDGLQITGFQGLGSSPLTDAVIGSSQDNGIELWHGSSRWASLGPTCDGGFSLLDLDDVMTMYASSNCGPFLRSQNGGASWSAIFSGITFPAPFLFYPPIIQGPSPPHALFAATNQLYRSTDSGTTWTAVSPVLATGPSDEIAGGQNAITAIAVAPGAAQRTYVGYYGGQVFRSNPSPCATAGCWVPASNGLPEAPITRIAVHPKQWEVAWVTVSGFGAEPKVFRTVNGGARWAPSDTGLPKGVPANTISVEPSTPGNVFVGLDSSPGRSSLYKSTDGGRTWKPFSDGLPNAPVYEISIDETHGRIYAATHGRGAYVISKGFTKSFKSSSRGGPRDIALFGQNFPPNQACSVQIVQSNGKVCASGSADVTGGAIKTDSGGVLTTDKPSFWKGKPMIWACLDGHCVGGNPISACSLDSADGKKSPSTVVVSCGGEPAAAAPISGRRALENPPSTLL